MRADAERRRARIVSEARQLFAQHGPDVALESIATASEVGIATLYRNFATRAQLVDAVTENIVQSVHAAAEECRRAAATEPVAAWTAFIADLVDLDLGALTDSLDVGESARPSDAIAQSHARAHAALTGVLDDLHHTVRAGLTVDGLIVAIATITRPHPVTRRAGRSVTGDLVDAYIAWTLVDAPGSGDAAAGGNLHDVTSVAP